MKLFTVGPVEKFPSTMKVAGSKEPYFRNQEFSALMLDNEQHLKRLLHADATARVIFLTCSGSGALEASVLNAFDHHDRVLVINEGTFGQRFCDICQTLGVPYQAITIADLATVDATGFTGLLVNMHETSTGKLYPMPQIAQFCQKHGLKLVVDAISSFLAAPIDFAAWGVDILIISSQKALALSCGMAACVLSARMQQKLKPVRSLYFNFADYLKNMQRGQTPFTPAVNIMYELNDRIKQLNLQDELDRVAHLAQTFRRLIKCQVPDYPLCNALTPIYVPHARQVYQTLKDQYGFEVTPCGGANADTMLRIGHIGNVSLADTEKLARCINELVWRHYQQPNFVDYQIMLPPDS